MEGKPGQEMLAIGEAAAKLGVSLQTLRRWALTGRLRPAFVSPGGHRYYAVRELEQFKRDLTALAYAWAAKAVSSPPPEYYCQTSSIFQARLASFETAVRTIPGLSQDERYSLVTAIVGEIGDNAFAHNLGNWPDTPGVFFAFDPNRRQVVVADRGVGVLTTLRRVKPELRNDRQALTVAFTERLSGRTPENRGNGLKFVRQVIAHNPLKLVFHSGSAILTLRGMSPELHLTAAHLPLRGTLASLAF